MIHIFLLALSYKKFSSLSHRSVCVCTTKLPLHTLSTPTTRAINRPFKRFRKIAKIDFWCHHVFLSVCLSVCLSARLSVRPSVCPSVCLSVCLSARPSFCLPACPSVCLSVRPSVCLPARLSVCLSVCPHKTNPLPLEESS